MKSAFDNGAPERVLENEGDVLSPLRKLKEKYERKINELIELEYVPAAAITFYIRAALSISGLLPNRYEEGLNAEAAVNA